MLTRWIIWLAVGCAVWQVDPVLRAQTVADYAVRVSAVVQTNPPMILLSWPGDGRATGYQISRKARDATSWGPPINRGPEATNHVDSNVTRGTGWEYRISKTASNYTGEGYIYAGIELPFAGPRGKVILVVDNTHAVSLAPELTRLERDLVGDGWTVLRHDVARTDSVSTVKTLIRNDYTADQTGVKAVFLFGHVPVPYSGNLYPDGHTNHAGAWPTDVFYGEMTSTWRDIMVTATNASDPRNRNVPGDGKFDPTTLPSDVELQVGRVDLANLPSFASSEVELLRQYLNKDHQFRHGFVRAAGRGLIDDHFGTFDGEAFAVNGWRNFAPFFGASNTIAGDWLSTLSEQSYLWGYGCGGGSYTSAGGVASTSQLATNDPQVVFTMLFGSYFGDWDTQDNFLRAALATPSYTLSCAWAGRPHWQFHHMALGETLGFSTRLTQNNSTLYDANSSARYVHIALMGDPTLRLHPVTPPGALVVTKNGSSGFDLGWKASPDNVAGYVVYRATTMAGPFTRLNTTLLAATNYTDSVLTTNVYMVRAVKLEVTSSGSHFNSSQGIFQDLHGTLGPPSLALVQPTNNATFLAPADIPLAVTTFDYANSISTVEYYADDLKLGQASSPTLGLVWSNAPPGSYALTARALTDAGLVATSGVVNVRVDAVLLAAGSVWKYRDDGSDQGTAWRTAELNDADWSSGAAELGYSNSPVTVVSFGPDPANKHVTTYFRHVFTVENPAAYTNLTLALLRDDGAVVYLNEAQIFRSNMPGGLIDYHTLASSEVTGSAESTYYRTAVSPGLLRRGTNVLAAEVHLAASDSPDLGFDLYLTAITQPWPPSLAIALEGASVVLSWPTDPPGYQLESTASLLSPAWSSVTNEVQVSNGVNRAVVEVSEGGRFFRLVQR